jgi:hypothetical protein
MSSDLYNDSCLIDGFVFFDLVVRKHGNAIKLANFLSFRLNSAYLIYACVLEILVQAEVDQAVSYIILVLSKVMIQTNTMLRHFYTVSSDMYSG